MTLQEELRSELEGIYREWYAGIDTSGREKGWGELCGGITILENLMRDYILDLDRQQTRRGTQLKNAGSSLGQSVLNRFGVTLKVRLGEFGRTSRGGPRAAGRLMGLLEPLHLENLSHVDRNAALLFLQEPMVHDLEKFSERIVQVIKVQPKETFEKLIGDILAAAPSIASGAVAQHLVGAKLTLRFPMLTITNDVAAAADAPTNRPGDFLINDTAFHITLAPGDAVLEKCKENLRQGYNVYLLVPEKTLSRARKRAEERHNIKDRIIIKSIESFVAQNIDEIAIFSKEEFEKQKEALIQVYNERIDKAGERYAPHLSLSEGDVKMEGVVDEEAGEAPVSSEGQNGHGTDNMLDLLENS